MERYRGLKMLLRESDYLFAEYWLMRRLLQVFARFLPDLKATFSIFDQPQVYLSWARRGSLVEMGLHGERT